MRRAALLLFAVVGSARSDEPCRDVDPDIAFLAESECVEQPKKPPEPPKQQAAPPKPSQQPEPKAPQQTPVFLFSESAPTPAPPEEAAAETVKKTIAQVVTSHITKQSAAKARELSHIVVATVEAPPPLPPHRPLQIHLGKAWAQAQQALALSEEAVNASSLEEMKETARAAFEGPSIANEGVIVAPRATQDFFSGKPAPVVGGVNMAFDVQALRASLLAAAEAAPDSVARMEDRLIAAAMSAHPMNGFLQLEAAARRDALGGRRVERDDALAAVSLRALADAAERWRDRWSELPAELRHPGGIKRIRGVQIDRTSGDIVLLGTTGGPGEAIDVDDLAVGLNAVWKSGESPFCSLDPRAEDPSGPQHARIGGVAGDSSFAKTMLDADYAMKLVMDDIEHVDVAGYQTLLSLVRDGNEAFFSRFWFYPIQPRAGDIQMSADGGTILFSSDVQVLSEEITLAKQGIVGMGRRVAVADQAAASFSDHHGDIARHKPVVGKLMALFDLVLLAKILKSVGAPPATLDRIAALPHLPVAVPDSYPGVKVVLGNGWLLTGGVEIRVDENRSSWLPLGAGKTALLQKSVERLRRSRSVAAPLPGAAIELPVPVANRSEAERKSTNAALARLRAGDLRAALDEASANVRSSPADADARLILALVRLARSDFAGARRSAWDARALAPRNRLLDEAATRVVVESDAGGDLADALAELDAAVARWPESAELHLLRGRLLFALNRAPDARGALKRAIEADPANPAGYAFLSVVEGAQGWPFKAKALARKAYALGAQRVDTRAALALAELRLANLSAAGKLANETLEDAKAEPLSRCQLFVVAMTAAAGLERNMDKVDGYVQKSADLPPPLRAPLLNLAAELATELGRPDLAARYRTELR